MRKTCVAAIAAACTALIFTPAANADPFSSTDLEYLQELSAYGLNPATLHAPNPAAEVSLGHGVCEELAKGRTPNDLVSSIGRSLPNLSLRQSQGLISVAVINYCPNVLSRPLPWSPQS